MIFVDTDYDTYKNPVEGKTYISPQMINKYGSTQESIRLITRGMEQANSYEMVKVKNEVLLRETDRKKYITTAKVFESNNQVFILNIQEYTASSGNPHKKGITLVGNEITKLYDFIRDVQMMHFGSKKYQSISDDDINYLNLTDSQVVKIVQENPDLFAQVVASNITKQDIIAFAYRKKQLDIFKQLLEDDNYFSNVKNMKSITSNEALWQNFFEMNPWIFGYGLGYIFLTGLDDKKLEQVVQGYSLANKGKRIDAVMQTKGVISNLCFVEIKTHKTKLLGDKPYRSSCYAPSSELSGAISQIQISVAAATKTLTEKLHIVDDKGNPTKNDIYNYQAKSFLVIGSLDEFVTENGINEEKLQSFELFRKNITTPEIITFDELYERARFIVEHNQNIFNNSFKKSEC